MSEMRQNPLYVKITKYPTSPYWMYVPTNRRLRVLVFRILFAPWTREARKLASHSCDGVNSHGTINDTRRSTQQHSFHHHHVRRYQLGRPRQRYSTASGSYLWSRASLGRSLQNGITRPCCLKISLNESHPTIDCSPNSSHQTPLHERLRQAHFLGWNHQGLFGRCGRSWSRWQRSPCVPWKIRSASILSRQIRSASNPSETCFPKFLMIGPNLRWNTSLSIIIMPKSFGKARHQRMGSFAGPIRLPLIRTTVSNRKPS